MVNYMNKYKIILFADNPEKREKGLMFTDPLEEDECALFKFPRVGDHSFWNKNVSYNLCLVFCNENNKVLKVKKMKAESVTPCRAGSDNVKYVVEMHENAFNKINENDILVISNDGETLYFLNK